MPIEDKSEESFYKALDITIQKYNSADCHICMTCCNNEFESLMEKVKDEMNITMDYSDPGEHELSAERNNCVLEEWFCTAMHCVSVVISCVVTWDGGTTIIIFCTILCQLLHQ